MSSATQAPTTVSNIGVVMFAVADQDAALAFYTREARLRGAWQHAVR